MLQAAQIQTPVSPKAPSLSNVWGACHKKTAKWETFYFNGHGAKPPLGVNPLGLASVVVHRFTQLPLRPPDGS